MRSYHRVMLIGLVLGLTCVGAGFALPQPIQDPKVDEKTDPKFEFEVLESFDAQYLGDLPGHVGRDGLNGRRPNIALGDPVFRANEQIGTVTVLKWNRVNDSLEVEFDPLPNHRIFVGESVWVHLDGSRYDKIINRPKIVP